MASSKIRRPWIELRDIPYCLILPLMAVAAWVVPQRHWKSFCNRLVDLLLLGPDALGKVLLGRIEKAAAGIDLKKTPREIARAYVANKLLLQFEYFRSLWGKGLNCQIKIKGLEHLKKAYASGPGAILWVTPASSSDYIVKRGFAEYGYPVSHLSDLTHGYSASKFGIRYINGINRFVENKYLKHRIILDRNSPKKPIDELKSYIDDDAILSVTAVENKGGRNLYIPLFSCQLPLGAGAIVVAHKTGSPLLPVFTTRIEDGHYEIAIQPPLEVRTDLPREQVIEQVLACFSQMLAKHVEDVPDQWYGWTHLKCAKVDETKKKTLWDWINKAA